MPKPTPKQQAPAEGGLRSGETERHGGKLAQHPAIDHPGWQGRRPIGDAAGPRFQAKAFAATACDSQNVSAGVGHGRHQAKAARRERRTRRALPRTEGPLSPVPGPIRPSSALPCRKRRRRPPDSGQNQRDGRTRGLLSRRDRDPCRYPPIRPRAALGNRHGSTRE